MDNHFMSDETEAPRSETQQCLGWYTRMPWILFVWVFLVILAPGIVILMFFADAQSRCENNISMRDHEKAMMETSILFLLLPFRPLGILYEFLYDIMRNTFAALSAMLFSILHIAYWITLICWFFTNPEGDHSLARQWEIAHKFLMNLF